MSLLLATVRAEVANYLSALVYVYILLILVHIVTRWLFAFGLRLPYSRASGAVLGFLSDVCEPLLRVFRRVIPSVGAFDFSPIVAIVVLEIINSVLIQGLLHG